MKFNIAWEFKHLPKLSLLRLLSAISSSSCFLKVSSSDCFGREILLVGSVKLGICVEVTGPGLRIRFLDNFDILAFEICIVCRLVFVYLAT